MTAFVPSQRDIIEAVRAGRLEYRWTDLPGADGIQVFEDAAKIGGVRIPVSARTTAVLVEMLAGQVGALISPTTALVEDLIYNAADLRCRPLAQDVARPEKSVPAFNENLDRQIGAMSSGRPGWGLVAGVGKSWILDNRAIEHPGYAVNYGFHWPAGTQTTKDGPWPSVDGKSMVYQQPSTRHDPDHWDYSQTLRLVKLEPGAKLPSHEPLRATRLWY